MAAAQQPDRHTQRYDRQLRLWNSSGQSSLEGARVLVLGASSLAAQLLKCLVLPGVGAFTVCDDAVASEEDVGANFFLQPGTSEGRPCAAEVARLVAELNPGVRHDAKIVSPQQLLEEPDAMAPYTLVVSVRQPRAVDERAVELCWAQSPPVPFFCAKSAGLVGAFSVNVPEVTLVETHPDSLVDLRLTRPFPALEQFAERFDLRTPDSLARAHIPFVVILLRAFRDWRAAHDGKLPSSGDRRAFQAHLATYRPEDSTDPENFDEASAALAPHMWRPLQAPAVPEPVRKLLDDAQARNVGPSSPRFWLLAAALRRFVEEEQVLPLPGSLPDMKATSATYVELQQVYHGKAQADLAAVQRQLDAVLAEAGRTREEASISDADVQTFVKHAAVLRVQRGRPLVERRKQPNTEAITLALQDPVNPVTIQYWVALLAADEFQQRTGRYPGQGRDGVNTDEDTAKLEALVLEYVQSIGVPVDEGIRELYHSACAEIVRSAHSDIVSTAAFLGGVMAQEAIKVITRQYIPLDNTCVYDGVAEAVGSFRL